MRETYELRVGFFILGATILLVGGWGWLKGLSLVDPPQMFWVRFHDVAGLTNNATINVQGVRAGNVDQITFKLPEGLTDAPEPDTEKAQLPKVYARMKLTAMKVPIPKNAEVTIQTLGMVGAKYVEITLPPVKPDAPVDSIDPQLVVAGRDPVRVELVVNNIAKKINQAADAISSDEAAGALKHISKAAEKLDKSLDNVPALTASLRKTSDTIEVTARKFGKTADKTEVVADNANKFFNQGKTSFESVNTLATGLNQTNKKVGKLLDNPGLSKDLRETVDLAHKTAQSVQAAITELSGTVRDKELRKDLLALLTKIQSSSEDIRQSMQVVNKLADDKGLRTDVKGALQDAREAMSKANTMLSDQSFRMDITQTMGKMRTAAADVDLAARQVHQILGKRAPLLHMLMGKPGELTSDEATESFQDGTSVKKNGNITK
jgi:phospholipid/cholesterol/gamma-HCH transport system substrate-binding protein